jgi:hypothetical protein
MTARPRSGVIIIETALNAFIKFIKTTTVSGKTTIA